MAQQRSQESMDALLAQYHRADSPLTYSPVYETKKIKVPNPAYLRLPADRRDQLAAAYQIDKEIDQTVEVMSWQNKDVLIKAYIDPNTGQYQVEDVKPDITPTSPSAGVGPQQRALAEEEAQRKRDERSWNANNGPQTIDANGQPGRGSGLSETHAERTQREFGAQDQTFQQENQARAGRTEERAVEAARLQAEQQRAQNELAQAKFDYDKEKDVRPQMASTPTDATKNIAIWDPASQTVRSVENPMYDAAKAEAARLKDQLSTGIALNQITAQQAAQQYKQWWDTNVELPFKQAAEVRARAAEQRAALEAEDRRKQFASDFSLRKANLGFTAGNAAVQNEMGLLPYRAGPTEAAEMSAAITSLGQGGKIAGSDASAGINFTPGAFEFDRPDFEGIAQKATKNALKGLTKYSPEGSFSQGSYEGISMPSGEGAPSSTGGGIDLGSLWQQYLQQGVEPYSGPPEE